jgi:two-component system sensor histidine kinase BaeS
MPGGWRGQRGDGNRWRGMRRWGWLWALAGLTMVLLACIGGTALFWLVASDVGNLASPLGAFGRRLSGAAFIIGLVGVVFVVRMFRATARPIGDLMDAAARVETGDFSARVRVRGPRGVRQLTSAFNAMAERLQANEDARRNLLADVTHELRTPLTIIQGNLEGVLDGIYPRDDAHLAPILEESRVMARLIEDLRMLSLAESGALTLQREPADLSALARDAATAFQGQADAAGVTLGVSAPEPLIANVDEMRIRAVLNNLIANALRYTPGSGTVTVDVARDGDKARIEVSDTGKGIPPDVLPHIFDRFYKGRDSLGTGLGLAIAKQLVQAHGGEIVAESGVGRGTKITIALSIEAHP